MDSKIYIKMSPPVKSITSWAPVFESDSVFGKIKHLIKYKTFENKLITNNYRIQNKLIGCEIFKVRK